MQRPSPRRVALMMLGGLLVGCAGVEPVAPADEAGSLAATGAQLAEPSGVVASATSDSTVALTWQDNSSNETGFEIERAQGSGDYFSFLVGTAANVTQLRDAGLASATRYCYRIRALRLKGNTAVRSSYSATSCAQTTSVAVSPTAPQAPSSATAVGSSPYRVEVRWQDNSADESRFEVYRSTTGASGAFSLLVMTVANTTLYVDEAVLPAAQYCYQVRAVRLDAMGAAASAFTTPACATTPAQALASPAFGLTAKPYAGSGIYLWWNTVAESGDQSRVDRSMDGAASWDSIGVVAYDVRNFVDGITRQEQLICYRVVTFNALGAAAPSDAACTALLAAPSALTAVALEGGGFDLAWHDDSAYEDGYELWQMSSRSSCCSGDSACDAGVYDEAWLVATLPPNTTTFRSSGRLYQDGCSSDAWSYEVRATRDGGFSPSTSLTMVP